jgi:hypothetical protein
MPSGRRQSLLSPSSRFSSFHEHRTRDSISRHRNDLRSSFYVGEGRSSDTSPLLSSSTVAVNGGDKRLQISRLLSEAELLMEQMIIRRQSDHHQHASTAHSLETQTKTPRTSVQGHGWTSRDQPSHYPVVTTQVAKKPLHYHSDDTVNGDKYVLRAQELIGHLRQELEEGAWKERVQTLAHDLRQSEKSWALDSAAPLHSNAPIDSHGHSNSHSDTAVRHAVESESSPLINAELASGKKADLQRSRGEHAPAEMSHLERASQLLAASLCDGDLRQLNADAVTALAKQLASMEAERWDVVDGKETETEKLHRREHEEEVDGGESIWGTGQSAASDDTNPFDSTLGAQLLDLDLYEEEILSFRQLSKPGNGASRESLDYGYDYGYLRLGRLDASGTVVPVESQQQAQVRDILLTEKEKLARIHHQTNDLEYKMLRSRELERSTRLHEDEYGAQVERHRAMDPDIAVTDISDAPDLSKFVYSAFKGFQEKRRTIQDQCERQLKEQACGEHRGSTLDRVATNYQPSQSPIEKEKEREKPPSLAVAVSASVTATGTSQIATELDTWRTKHLLSPSVLHPLRSDTSSKMSRQQRIETLLQPLHSIRDLPLVHAFCENLIYSCVENAMNVPQDHVSAWREDLVQNLEDRALREHVTAAIASERSGRRDHSNADKHREHITCMQAGTDAILLRAKKKGERRNLRLSPDSTVVEIRKKSKDKSPVMKIPVASMEWIVYGPYTDAFKRRKAPAAVCFWRSFSVIHGPQHETLDLELTSDAEAQAWVLGLQQLAKEKIVSNNRQLFTTSSFLFKRLRWKITAGQKGNLAEVVKQALLEAATDYTTDSDGQEAAT